MTTQTAVTVPAPRTPPTRVELVGTSCGHPASPDTTYQCAADPWDAPHCEACHAVGHCTDCDQQDADTADYEMEY